MAKEKPIVKEGKNITIDADFMNCSCLEKKKRKGEKTRGKLGKRCGCTMGVKDGGVIVVSGDFDLNVRGT